MLEQALQSGPAPAACASNLANYDRGAILVPALAMGVLLVGAMFYVAAVGNAIMFRTELQNAADVTSFSSAVWHARGMNLIAVLNILMSFGLAIFATIRVAEIVCFLIGLIPLIGSPFMSLATNLVAKEDKIAKIISQALNVVEGAQSAVSVAVPYVALADAKLTSTAASTAWPLSLSLVPPIVDKGLGQKTRRPESLPAALPIQAGNFGRLCGKATFFIPKQVTNMMERINLPGAGTFKRISDTIMDDIGGTLMEKTGGMFCQPLVGGLMEAVSTLLNGACDEVQNMDDEAEDAKVAEEEAKRKQEAKPGDKPEDLEEAKKRKKARLGKRADGKKRDKLECGAVADKAGAAKNASMFTVKPAMVWEAAANGSVFMHSWSWVTGEPKLLGPNRRAIGVADHGRLGNVTPSDSATAMGEFYFDCDEEWSEKCEPDALWAANWTARIRRFRPPQEEFVRMGQDWGFEMLETLQQPVGARVTDIIGGAMNEAIGLQSDNALARWLGEKIDNMPMMKTINEKIDSVVGGLRESTGVDKFLDPSRYTNPDRIH